MHCYINLKYQCQCGIRLSIVDLLKHQETEYSPCWELGLYIGGDITGLMLNSFPALSR